MIRKLAIEGKLKEADEYVQHISEIQARMVKRFTVPTMRQIEAEMKAEFPYDPYTEQY